MKCLKKKLKHDSNSSAMCSVYVVHEEIYGETLKKEKQIDLRTFSLYVQKSEFVFIWLNIQENDVLRVESGIYILYS